MKSESLSEKHNKAAPLEAGELHCEQHGQEKKNNVRRPTKERGRDANRQEGDMIFFEGWGVGEEGFISTLPDWIEPKWANVNQEKGVRLSKAPG